MDETQKPFACKTDGCGMSFTNEDHLNVHTKKHAMVLQLSLGTKAASFVADQTPTPTRLIRNCDEVGLFDDLHLQHVNPFDETFRRAVESKSTATTPNLQHNGDDDGNHNNHMLLSDVLKCTAAAEESLHTPHVLPFYDDCRYRCIATVSDATTSAHPDDVCFTRSGGVVTESRSTGETSAGSTKTLTVMCRKRKLLKQTIKPISLLIKSATPIEVKDAHPVVTATEAENGTNFVKIVPKVTTISKQHLLRFTKATPLPDQPKSSEEPVKSVRQKLKESILRSNKESVTKSVIEPTRVAVLSSHVIKPITSQSIRKPPPKLTGNNKNLTITTAVNDSKHKLFERNREASKRYRKKMKIWHDETFKKNKELEEENKRLKAELTKLKTFMLAHQDCSVTRAMAQGKNIPVGLPTVMIKHSSKKPTNSNSPVKIAPALSVPLNTDITPNSLYFIVNKKTIKLEPKI